MSELFKELSEFTLSEAEGITNGACPEYFDGVYTERSEVLSINSVEGPHHDHLSSNFNRSLNSDYRTISHFEILDVK